MTSYIVYTDNSEKTIGFILSKILPLNKNEKLILFDNRSIDETVPIIINMVGILFTEEEQYKFYINSKKETKKDTLKKALTIAEGEVIIIDGEEEEENVKNK